MNEELKVRINEKELSITIYPNGKCVPYTNEVLMCAGLELLYPEIEKFYNMLGNVDSESLIKWVCYTIDSRYEQTRLKIKKYLLIDAGCRMCFGRTEQIRVDEFRMLRDFISALEDDRIFSYRELAAMLNKDGFEVTINSL